MYLCYPLVSMFEFKQFITLGNEQFEDKEIVFPPYGADQLTDILSEGLIYHLKKIQLKVMLYLFMFSYGS